VWPALRRTLERAFGGRRNGALARVLGCRDRGPLAGFAVVTDEPPRVLGLAGRHRFSRYALTFSLQPDGAGTVVRAETRAVFPGPHGRAYRALVVGSGLHVRVVRRLLAATAASCETRLSPRP
jgi:hypothetical protein